MRIELLIGKDEEPLTFELSDAMVKKLTVYGEEHKMSFDDALYAYLQHVLKEEARTC